MSEPAWGIADPLIPETLPEGVRECERCSGRGEHEVRWPDRDGNYDTIQCYPCAGTGWLA